MPGPWAQTCPRPDMPLGHVSGQIELGHLLPLLKVVNHPTRIRLISAARKIERSRTLFRRSLLASDYVLQGAVGLLKKVRDGQLRLDRSQHG